MKPGSNPSMDNVRIQMVLYLYAFNGIDSSYSSVLS